ncbi:hypothetical protein ACIBHY_17065 [Nonomuraea sp. NPDC050547]|uniref:hypothetical protein n=1 Tax=Nonomuraea sp. NPDC050547 TaxID=3364368 RepID=UPI0037A52519
MDLAESPASVWLGAELVRAAIVMRLSDVGSWARRQLCKLLISEFRTWGVLVPILVLAFSDVIKSEGWGVAVFTIPTVVVIYEGVAWLRKRWGVHVRHSDRSDRSDEDA